DKYPDEQDGEDTQAIRDEVMVEGFGREEEKKQITGRPADGVKQEVDHPDRCGDGREEKQARDEGVAEGGNCHRFGGKRGRLSVHGEATGIEGKAWVIEEGGTPARMRRSAARMARRSGAV